MPPVSNRPPTQEAGVRAEDADAAADAERNYRVTAYRAEIWCDGCGVLYARGQLHEDASAAAASAPALNELALRDRWIRDGAAHWCPQCQIQRATGPIVDSLAIHVVEARA